jgi:fructose/tagatose bisphosphate aldolase
MKAEELITELLALLEGSLVMQDSKTVVKDTALLKWRIHKLAEISALENDPRKGIAQYLIRLAAQASGIFPASIHDLYKARGRGEIPSTFTVPALNLRAMAFDAARAVFRVANDWNAMAFIFEIARSEMGYTDQRPAEYTSSVLAAGIAEGYHGAVFIQGDHFQVSAKRYASDPEAELKSVDELIEEAIKAGFYNIDIDTSTLVDLTKTTIAEQQELNSELTARYTNFIRLHQPSGIIISIGGEIGEVGGHNSTEAELRGYMDGYIKKIGKKTALSTGLSKISIQTGTSHGGIVLPDGSIAKVNVDFQTLFHLGQVAKNEYGMAGAVQHGASTLPEDAFGKFVEAKTAEVHLATNFMNLMYECLPDDLKVSIYAYLDSKNSNERKPGMTDEQFYYRTRKNAIGPFKQQLWSLDQTHKIEIFKAWETQFRKLFNFLALRDTRLLVEKIIKPVEISPQLTDYFTDESNDGDVSDLAD